MKITGQLKNQEEMELTLSITMRIKEWKELQESIPEKYPYWKLGGAITEAILKVGTTVYEEITSD